MYKPGQLRCLNKICSLVLCIAFCPCYELTGWHMNVPLDLRFCCISTSLLLFVLLLQFLSPAHCQLFTYTHQFPKQRTLSYKWRSEMSFCNQSLWNLCKLFCWFLWHQNKWPHQILRSSYVSCRDDTSLFLLSIYSYSSKLRAVF